MNALEARVVAANQAGTIANELRPKLVEVMRQFVGKKIVTQQNELTAQVKKAIAPVLETVKTHVYLDSYKSYSLRWIAKTCVSSDSRDGSYQHANYWEASIRVGSIRDHVLTAIDEDITPHKTDYSAKEIETARKAYETAQAVADELKGKLSPFGEYDR